MKYRKEAVHATNPEVLAAGRRKLVFAALAVLAVVLVAGTWLLVHSLQPKQNDAAVKPEMAVSQPKTVEKKQATEPAEHHGNSPDCPDTDCIAMLVNGDLLFHEGLWNQYASTNTAATDGTAFDFTGLFEPMRKYIDASDIAVCEFETPIAQRGGPYTGYPVFNIPAEVADAAKTWGIAPARMRRIIPGTKVLTASRACGTHLIRMASPRPAPIKPKRIRISRWSSIRLPVAVSLV